MYFSYIYNSKWSRRIEATVKFYRTVEITKGSQGSTLENEDYWILPTECFPTVTIWSVRAVCHLYRCNPSCTDHCTWLCRSLSRRKNDLPDNFWPPSLCAPDSSIQGISFRMQSAFPCTADSSDWKRESNMIYRLNSLSIRGRKFAFLSDKTYDWYLIRRSSLICKSFSLA